MIRLAASCKLALALAGGALAAEIPPGDLDRLPAAQVVILGEVHDNPAHHANQARALLALAPKAVVFEMLDIAQSNRITPALLRDPAALEAALGWNASGWPDFSMYAPLFQTTPTPRFLGGALREADLVRARNEGPAAAFGPGAARFGLDRPLDPADQAAREAEMQEAHCDALPPEILPRFVDVQRLRDAALALAVLAALKETGGPVAVIAGNGHARRDTGIPAALALAAPGVTVLSVAQFEGMPGPAPPHDLWLVTPDPARTGPEADPCAAFGQRG